MLPLPLTLLFGALVAVEDEVDVAVAATTEEDDEDTTGLIGPELPSARGTARLASTFLPSMECGAASSALSSDSMSMYVMKPKPRERRVNASFITTAKGVCGGEMSDKKTDKSE
jgi:hypothetical protein